ncbi:MAG: anti-sigma factor family protein, partial [Anaerotignum sp.]
MRCEDCRELLWAYLEQELNEEETAKMQQHLGECA